MFLMICLPGCASHFYRVEGDKLLVYLKNSQAEVVLLACSTDGYELHPAAKVNSTTWKNTLTADIEFRYFYMVDGMVFLPSCPFTEKDDFGSNNCLFIPGL